ncbi:MAG: hypothetical protein JXR25_05220 [Pontiellaceae bacterium]|nr:hypothetical protein [Pontiellaceae bacterium]MBN2784208.1 hypothetical protein [Pontiellaceae bacterium]
MKKMLILLSGIILCTAAAEARLGESIEECLIRYGEPKRSELNDELTGISIYKKNDLTITVHFLNGKANLVRYSPGQVSEVDLDLAKYLLQKNGRTKEWDQLTKTEIVLNEVRDENAQHPRVQLVDPILWKSKDGILDASFSISKGTFEIKASSYQEKIREGL